MYLHHLVVSDDLDGHLLVPLEGVSSTDHVAEHTFTSVPIDSVATIQLLTNTDTCVYMCVSECMKLTVQCRYTVHWHACISITYDSSLLCHPSYQSNLDSLFQL